MKRISWLTDIHLNFVSRDGFAALVDRVLADRPDVVLIGGDVGEAGSVADYLARLDELLRLPLYFVLGNHDFYGGSIRRVREAVEALCQQRPRLTYLSRSEAVELTPRVGLVGHDGWADGRVGDYAHSTIMLNDYRLIHELAGMGRRDRRAHLEALGDEAAEHVRRVLPPAVVRYEHVFLLTHVPPLREACWHEGRISDDEWSPHFTCQAMGNAFVPILRDHPDRRLTVLCGHTHSPGECRPLENVIVHTGQAEYGHPTVQRVWELE
jgi:predicted phosphohydrolase